MKTLAQLFDQNREWAANRVAEDPEFFSRLEKCQNPKVAWIGCSDSRVPANTITGLAPGEVFVHRNIANVVHSTSASLVSFMEYAIEVLQVEHLVVCGHYGCGGVKAALDDVSEGMVAHWLEPIRAQARQAAGRGEVVGDPGFVDRLCELNVLDQVRRLGHSPVVRRAFQRGQELELHSWCYRLNDGLLNDLALNLTPDCDPDERFLDRVTSA